MNLDSIVGQEVPVAILKKRGWPQARWDMPTFLPARPAWARRRPRKRPLKS